MAAVIAKHGSGKEKELGQSDTELKKMAHQCPALRGSFIGVFSKDTMPKCIRDGQCCVVNIQDTVDPQGNPLPGSHWVSAGRHKGQTWYFDSFGLGIPTEIEQALRKSGPGSGPVYHSSREIQAPDSDLCGLFALAACECVQWDPDDKPSVSLERFMSQFDRPNLKLNDRVVKEALAEGRRARSGTGFQRFMYKDFT